MTVAWPLTIYYDASCPLCREEMHSLAAADALARLRLHDISASSAIDGHCRDAGIGQAALMQAIHARDAEGRWFRGVDVFVLAYAAAGLDGVAGIWSHPRLRGLWDRLYPWVARHRQTLSRLHLNGLYGWLIRRAAQRAQRRSQGCAEGACAVPAASAAVPVCGRDEARAGE